MLNDEIIIEIHWSNNPIPIHQIIDDADCIIEIPFGVFTPYPSSTIQSVNGKTGAVNLNHVDVDADPTGAAAEVRQELETAITELSSSKLDKLDYIQHFRGLFSSYAALTVALPIALDGDYAHIDSGANFGRMAAIWDGDDNKWIINEVHAALNTDEMPEGNQNLYFKVDRVLQVPMTGLPVVAASDVMPTDVLLSVVAKLQAQIKELSTVWVDAVTIGTVSASIVDCRIQFARINGLLWIRGDFRSNLIFSGHPLITISNPNYKVKTVTLMSNAVNIIAMFNDYIADIVAVNGLRLAAYENDIQKIEANISHAAETFYFRKIQPTCLGQLQN